MVSESQPTQPDLAASTTSWRGGLARGAVRVLLAGTIAAGICLASYSATAAYYREAPFHFDSVVYRHHSGELHSLYRSQGLWAAVRSASATKDGLDWTLRLLFFPRSLTYFYGHLVVLVPFLALYVWLLLRYAERRTGSLASAVCCAALLFAAPFTYDPFLGLADYWKDGVATWMLGGAAACLLLSRSCRERRWVWPCGALLGLLVVQRTALAVYGAFVFAPVFLACATARVREEGWARGLAAVAPMVLLPAVIASPVALLQAPTLYRYYVIQGFDYQPRLEVVRFILRQAQSAPPLAVLACGAWAAAALSCVASRRLPAPSLLFGAWLVTGLPLAVVSSRGMYFEFLLAWLPLVCLSVCTLLPAAPRHGRAIMASLLLAALIGGLVQYSVCRAAGRERLRKNAPMRPLYDDLGDALLAYRGQADYGLFFDEVGLVFAEHVAARTGEPFPLPKYFMSVHETYYRATFGERTADDVADQVLGEMEATPGTLAVAHRYLVDLPRTPAFARPAAAEPTYAARVAARIASHLANSPGWQPVRLIESARYGTLCVYRYAPASDPALE